MNNFLWLEQRFRALCDGSWEHHNGIVIDTLDNPGWRVRIDLRETAFAAVDAEIKQLFASDDEWMVCRIVGGRFEGAGGPLMLGPIVQVFRNWIEGF